MVSLAVCRPLAYYAYDAVQDTYFVESIENLFYYAFQKHPTNIILFINIKYSSSQYSRFCKKYPRNFYKQIRSKHEYMELISRI